MGFNVEANVADNGTPAKGLDRFLPLKYVSLFVLHIHLGEQFAYQFSMDIGQAEVPALKTESQFFVIQAK